MLVEASPLPTSLVPLIYHPPIEINTLLKSLCYYHFRETSSEMFIICIYGAFHLCGVLALLWCCMAAASPGCVPPVTLSFPCKSRQTLQYRHCLSVGDTLERVSSATRRDPREPGESIGGGPGSRGKKGQGRRGSLPHASNATDVILPRNLPSAPKTFFFFSFNSMYI